MKAIERRLARLEPSLVGGAMMHTVGVWERVGGSKRDYIPAVHDLLKEVGEKAGDLTVIIRHFANSDDEIPPRGGQARTK